MSTPAGRMVTAVAAVAENGVIGDGENIPWHLPADFAHFKATTMGHVLILGRTTHEGIGRPLPGRETIVLTRDPDWSAEGVHVAHDVLSALKLADELLAGSPDERQVMVGGGGHVYAALMPYTDEQVISEIPVSPEGQTRYPEINRRRWREVRREPREGFTVVWWERVFACGGVG
ncbi:dihydrofolate reductase [Nocardioides sp. zg-536]|uniref:Dihydrofolate reductase n=1 Tax=Nocardioides faecalis TaxID=2803858 RepID=A0A939BY89_9ACTN|nr:dihydrofolate reductase [Nocardioides faecalis]MBM9460093.1 dihydrofolate reductase [Nocardioides faecalis]QVI60111.1 dihydrofolate reductase [Nocardioides faecalis]